jgi:hypothetical protein
MERTVQAVELLSASSEADAGGAQCFDIADAGEYWSSDVVDVYEAEYYGGDCDEQWRGFKESAFSCVLPGGSSSWDTAVPLLPMLPLLIGDDDDEHDHDGDAVYAGGLSPTALETGQWNLTYVPFVFVFVTEDEVGSCLVSAENIDEALVLGAAETLFPEAGNSEDEAGDAGSSVGSCLGYQAAVVSCLGYQAAVGSCLGYQAAVGSCLGYQADSVPSCTAVGSGAPVDSCLGYQADAVHSVGSILVSENTSGIDSEVKTGVAENSSGVVDANGACFSDCTSDGSGAPPVGDGNVCVEKPNFQVSASIGERANTSGHVSGHAGGAAENVSGVVDADGTCGSFCTSDGSGAPREAFQSVTLVVSDLPNPPDFAVKVGVNFPGEILELGFAAELTCGERSDSCMAVSARIGSENANNDESGAPQVAGLAVDTRSSWTDDAARVVCWADEEIEYSSCCTILESGASGSTATVVAPRPRRMRLSKAARRLRQSGVESCAVPAVSKDKGKGKVRSFAGLFAEPTTMAPSSASSYELEQLRLIYCSARELVVTGARKKDKGPLLWAVAGYESNAVLVLVRDYLEVFPKWTIVLSSSEADRIDIYTALEWIVGFVC